MKKVITIILVLSYSALFAQSLKKQVTTSIKDVTVYRQGAQVTRHAIVNFAAGNNEITVTNLISNLDPNTIQVKGLGTCTILSVLYDINNKKEEYKSKEILSIQKQYEENKLKMDTLSLRDEVYSKEESLLENYSIPTQSVKEPVLLSSYKESLNFYRSRLIEVKQKEYEINLQIKEFQQADKKLGELMDSLIAANDKPSGEMLIKVSSKKDTTVDLAISYYISKAGWDPVYDVRVNSVAEPIDMISKANVHQQTDEDWNNVKLTLTTSNPVSINEAPTLNKWTLTDYNSSRPSPTYFANNNYVTLGLGRLKGKVTDKSTGEAVPFASVIVSMNDKMVAGVNTDIDGYYTISSLEAGKYEVKVVYVGYKSTMIKDVIINADLITFLDISLETSVVALKEVEVKEYSVPLVAKDQTESGTTITSDEMSKMPGRSASSYAVTVAGVYEDGDINDRGIRRGYNTNNDYYNSNSKSYERKIESKAITPGSTSFTATSVKYNIDLPYTIPADGKNYSVQIKEFTIPANYEYTTSPGVLDNAFLIANINDWDDFNLIKGQANLYFEGTYIGKSAIDFSSVDDTLKLSLGNDQSINVKHERIKEARTKVFLSSSVKETFGWKISVRNNKKDKITINIIDQVPVAADDKINVEMLETSNGAYDDKTGFIKWKVDINPGETKKFTLEYSVKYPSYYKLNLD